MRDRLGRGRDEKDRVFSSVQSEGSRLGFKEKVAGISDSVEQARAKESGGGRS